MSQCLFIAGPPQCVCVLHFYTFVFEFSLCHVLNLPRPSNLLLITDKKTHSLASWNSFLTYTGVNVFFSPCKWVWSAFCLFVCLLFLSAYQLSLISFWQSCWGVKEVQCNYWHLNFILNGYLQTRPKQIIDPNLQQVSDEILMQTDTGYCSVVLMLDLTSAFDTVDHHILLDRLR